MERTDKINFERLRGLPVITIAEDLGFQVRGNATRCMNYRNHKNHDRDFSLSFDVRRNRWRCWVCNIGGSPIDLVMYTKGMDILAAARYLLKRYFKGKKPSPTIIPCPSRPESTPTPAENEQIYADLLSQGIITTAVEEFFKSRSIPLEVVAKFGIRAIDSPPSVSQYLQSRYTSQQRLASGLYSRKGGFLFQYHPLMIPYFLKGKPVYIQGRLLSDSDRHRYMNLSGIPIPCPYNVDCLESPNTRRVYLVEGAIDVLTLSIYGLPAVGVPGGYGFKPVWVDFFPDTKRVVVLFHNDMAGHRGTDVVVKYFTDRGRTVQTLDILPPDKDLNNLHVEGSLKALLQSALQEESHGI